jgi:hypothetical protein
MGSDKITPIRTEPRGDFPKHGDQPRPLRSAEEAKEYARKRLEDWRQRHGKRH